MKILQISTAEAGGGAEGSARNLFNAFRECGHESWLAVGTKASENPDVFEISRPPPEGMREKVFGFVASQIRQRSAHWKGARRLARILDRCADEQRWRDWRSGREEFGFPGSREIFNRLPARPDVVHCHNLHGWYFDLNFLPEIATRFPLILNLRDAWLLTGHCAYFNDCPRWEIGCGQCPDLQRYPGIRRDATMENRDLKREILKRAKPYLTAPSKWLLEHAQREIPEAMGSKVIANGIDLGVFRPGDRLKARERLNIPLQKKVVLFAAASVRNVYKDPDTMRRTILRLGKQFPEAVFVRLGADRPDKLLHNLHVIDAPFQRDPAIVADYYRGADVFIHTARAEAFGKTATESMACGTPVVATAVGGLPEQILENRTGFLAALGQAEEHAAAAGKILEDQELRNRLGAEAARRGAEFGLERQAKAFLDWYAEILSGRRNHP